MEMDSAVEDDQLELRGHLLSHSAAYQDASLLGFVHLFSPRSKSEMGSCDFHFFLRFKI